MDPVEVDRELDKIQAAEKELLERRNLMLAERSLEDVQKDADLHDMESQEDVSTLVLQPQKDAKFNIRKSYTGSVFFYVNVSATAPLLEMLLSQLHQGLKLVYDVTIPLLQ